MLPSGKRQMAARRSTIFLHVRFKRRLFFFFFFFGNMWLKKKERKSCSLRCFDECRCDAFSQMLDANTGGEQFCSYVRIKWHHSFDIPAWVWKWIDWFVWQKGSLKCRRPTYKIRIITKKKKNTKLAYIFIKQMNNQSRISHIGRSVCPPHTSWQAETRHRMMIQTNDVSSMKIFFKKTNKKKP